MHLHRVLHIQLLDHSLGTLVRDLKPELFHTMEEQVNDVCSQRRRPSGTEDQWLHRIQSTRAWSTRSLSVK